MNKLIDSEDSPQDIDELIPQKTVIGSMNILNQLHQKTDEESKQTAEELIYTDDITYYLKNMYPTLEPHMDEGWDQNERIVEARKTRSSQTRACIAQLEKKFVQMQEEDVKIKRQWNIKIDTINRQCDILHKKEDELIPKNEKLLQMKEELKQKEKEWAREKIKWDKKIKWDMEIEKDLNQTKEDLNQIEEEWSRGKKSGTQIIQSLPALSVCIIVNINEAHLSIKHLIILSIISVKKLFNTNIVNINILTKVLLRWIILGVTPIITVPIILMVLLVYLIVMIPVVLMHAVGKVLDKILTNISDKSSGFAFDTVYAITSRSRMACTFVSMSAQEGFKFIQAKLKRNILRF